MKTLISTAVAAAFVMSSSVMADESKPVELSAAQMDQVTAGVGANNVAFLPQPWGALGSLPQEFVPAHLPQSDNGMPNASGDNPAIGALEGVAVPSVVPGSLPF